ncbi:PD-(D/E)XK nuclease family protein [Treponema vincentii]|uniref:PD-(D/E)XK nuclease family protein n=1 Tax=Treponema vincentii TaxID=69710 RepID=UPI0020A46EAA|nr:PD-(D/E)XK nuclease family protein [Treponema vincentii]UTC46749.1 PD-(D/E)XK nuclease family protein [Treponema vincentii]
MRIISGCSTIEDCIRRYGTDARTCFVFPSRIAARLWMHRALALTGLAAVPAELFIAWDAFKAECCIAQAENKNPVSQIIRLLFAHHIAADNAAAAKPFLQNIIPADYAADGAIFAQWIAGILPQLDHWEKRAVQHKAGKDAEFSDLRILKKTYTEFLDAHRLFEPSWAGAEFIPHAQQYILLYHELMEDFDEYRGLLEERQELSILPAPSFQAETTPLIQFGTMREEIRATALAVEQLLTNGVPADDIALSIAGIEDTVPYLKREFALRNIPAEFRLGFKLGEQQAGQLFPLLEQCVQEHYSFESLKPLLLNPHIPWKHPAQIQALINFGIKNNCLVSWKDEGHYKNVWKEAFKLPIPYNPHSSVEAEQAEKEQAKDWLLPFMQAAERLVQAKTFSEVQRQYILFRTQYLNIDGFSFEDNAVIGRCVTLMQELTQLEQDFADCLPAQPYRFFTAQLAREIYVPQNTGRAVSIFPFRVAAATPFAHHFVLNCNQKASRVIYQKLPFLRKDKRDALGVVEKDATQAFFAVYAEYGAVRFSASEQTFAGFTVSNGIFIALAPRPDFDESDSFLQEYRFFKREYDSPAALYSVQKTGFEQFAGIKKERGFSFLTEPFNGSLPVLSEKLKAGHYTDGAFRISQSGLHLFSGCPAQWFLSSALSIDEEDTDAELFNPRYIGIICHRVLELLYQRIRETDKVFISAHLADYREWAELIFNETVHSQTDFRGPLAAPFIESIKKRSLKSVAFVLTFDAEKLDGYTPYIMEGELQYRSGDILYHGLVDRIAYQEAEGRAVIIDYKTGKVPSATDYASEAMRDFQMPMYIFLAENRLKQEVLHAFFLGITKEERRYIVNDKEVIPQDSSRSSKTREEFEPSIQAFLQIAQEYAQQVGMEDFRKPAAVQWQDCMGCPFHTICRTTFTVEE